MMLQHSSIHTKPSRVSKCRGKGNYFGKHKVRFADDKQSDQQPEETSKDSKNKKLKVAKALTSILDEDSK